VLRNLVSNAIKFTPEGGTVEVSGRPTGHSIEFSVHDSGVGLTPEAARALFEPVVQPTRGTAGEVGTGLGVAVCRQFVALLGGELRVESTPGQGTRFWFVIPAAPAAVLA
jgi:signal transduction histidine kinase